ILLVIDRIAPPPVHFDATELPLRKALWIGFCQCLAMVPGVSRSGATIVVALMLGVEKRAAAEFSFLLSLPTMGAAVAYDLFKSRDLLDFSAVADIAVGFAVAFLAAIIVVRAVLGFIGRHGYAMFGWWRITVGTLALIGLWAGA
ncbi:MAG: undecaprenyl-diphosphate phosphatase, partial [Pseudorhodobacter sp.]|nr:undecaprenyl-diphosphate phosphatase [Pseudorhodobacter sp.]